MLNRSLRLLNVGLGLWVVLSSFLWPRDTGNVANLWLTGVVIIVSALLAIRLPSLRFVNTAAGVWLIASLFAWPNYSSPMVWNNALCGAAVALSSLVGPEQADMIAS